VTPARDELLARVVADVAEHGLRDRSLRELATSMGTSHRMLLYHFGSREQLVDAVVGAVESSQQEVLRALAAECSTAPELIRALWSSVSDPAVLPFVRLFFESVGFVREASARDLTSPWLEVSEELAPRFGLAFDATEVRLGVAVVRGLLIDVLMTGDRKAATAALERYITLWEKASPAARAPRRRS
jgi:AcrR family transcriptional regulator